MNKISILPFLLKLRRVRFEQMILPSLPSSERISTVYIQHLAHIHDLNIFSKLFSASSKTTFWSLFTTSTIKRQWHFTTTVAIQASSFLQMIICFMHALIMSEKSHHHYVLNSATLWNKGELHLLIMQTRNYCCLMFNLSCCYRSSPVTWQRTLILIGPLACIRSADWLIHR